MLAWCRRENNVAVIPVISALAGASRAHRNIWSTGTLSAQGGNGAAGTGREVPR